MTPKRKPVVHPRPIAPISGQPMPTFQNMEHTDDCKRSGCVLVGTCKARSAPLPRAVRELLRDVVLWHRTEDDRPSSEDMANRAARILGVPWDRIVAKARKAGR